MPAATFPYERLVGWVARRHVAILVATAALAAISALSLVRLRLDMDVLAQLPTGSKVFADYSSFLRGFGALDNLVVLVRGPQADVVPFATALAERLERLPEIASVRYRVDVDRVHRGFIVPFRAELLADDEYRELEHRLEPSAIDERVRGLKRALAAPMAIGARRWIAADPLGIDELVGRSLARGYSDTFLRPSGEYFLSRGGDALVMLVRPVASAFDTIFAERMLDRVEAAERDLLAAEFRGRQIEVGHTGSYVYAVADKRVMQGDFQIYFVVAPLAVLAVFHLGLRTLRILPFVTLPLLVTTVVTFALSLVVYGSLNMMSVAFAGIFYGLGIDSSIYFYHLLRDKAAGAKALDTAATERAVADTLHEIGGASVVASTTTAAAFLVIGLSDFTGVSQLGMMTAAAMMLNIVATFVMLPAMVFAWGPSAIPRAAHPGRFADAASRLSVWIAARRRAIGAATLAVLLAVGLAGLPRLRLDTDFTHLRPGGGDAERVERVLEREFGRIDADGVVIVGAKDHETALEATERVTAELEKSRAAGIVRSYASLTTFFPSAKTAAAREQRFRALPRADAARALDAALARQGFDVGAFTAARDDLLRDDRSMPALDAERDGPLAPLVERHFRRDADGVAIATYVTPTSSDALGALKARLEEALPGVSLVVTGSPIVAREFAALLRRDLAWFLCGSLVLNLALVLFAERSVRRALALLSPTLAALVVYLGLMGLSDVAIDPINLIVLPLLIGLGVDDGVYLTAHVRAVGGLRGGMRRGVVPLLLAVATTIVGFGSLGLSRYPALGRLGSLAALGLTLCVVAALVAVPLFARLLAGDETRDETGRA